MKKEWFRTNELIGEEAIERLENSKVLVFGVGGVGSYVVEALARSGVGHIAIVDKDVVDLTNLNRQLIATQETVGIHKVEVAKKRILSINPDCLVEIYPIFYLPETADQINMSAYHYVVDAVDTVTAKIEIISQAKKAGVPVISSMGTGNKLDPTKFEVADISETSVCPLAKVMRKELSKRGISDVKVIFSKEQPKHKRIVGSVPFVPSVAGLIIAGEVIKSLAKIK